MDIKQVAVLLGRSVNMVRRYVAAEDLPCRRVRNRLIFNESEVREWAAREENAVMMRIGEAQKQGRQSRVCA